MKKVILIMSVFIVVMMIVVFCNDHIIIRTQNYTKGSMNGHNEVNMMREVHEGKLVGPRHFVSKDECTIKMTLEQFLLSGHEWDSNSYEWRW